MKKSLQIYLKIYSFNKKDNLFQNSAVKDVIKVFSQKNGEEKSSL